MAGGHPTSSGDGIPEPKASLSPAAPPMHLSPAFASEVPSCLTQMVSGEWPGGMSGARVSEACWRLEYTE